MENTQVVYKKGDLFLCPSRMNLLSKENDDFQKEEFREVELLEVFQFNKMIKTDYFEWITVEKFNKINKGKIGTVKYYGFWIFKWRCVIYLHK